MGYYEGELNVSNGCGNNGGMWNDGIWAILLLALLGNRGFGFGGGNYGGGQGYGCGCFDNFGYYLGQVATTNDVASGFNNSAVLNNLNGIKENQLSMQNFINQGFAGLSSQLIGEFRNVDNAICSLGYQNQAGFNTIAHQISDCCCQTQRAIDGVNYNMATNTSAVVQAINAGNQKIIDYMQNEKIDTLNRKLSVAENALNQCQNNAYLINQIKPCPVPSYNVPNPFCCNTVNNGCCGCGNF